MLASNGTCLHFRWGFASAAAEFGQRGQSRPLDGRGRPTLPTAGGTRPKPRWGAPYPLQRALHHAPLGRPLRALGAQRYACSSQSTIQLMPNRSVQEPKYEPQNMSCSAIVTVPPSESLAKSSSLSFLLWDE